MIIPYTGENLILLNRVNLKKIIKITPQFG
jgi:hypothetical protein